MFYILIGVLTVVTQIWLHICQNASAGYFSSMQFMVCKLDIS